MSSEGSNLLHEVCSHFVFIFYIGKMLLFLGKECLNILIFRFTKAAKLTSTSHSNFPNLQVGFVFSPKFSYLLASTEIHLLNICYGSVTCKLDKLP
jgi:hypothetical protein